MGVRTGLAALVALPVVAALAVDPGGAAPFGPTRWWLVSTLTLVGSGLVLLHTQAGRPDRDPQGLTTRAFVQFANPWVGNCTNAMTVGTEWQARASV